MGSRGRAPQVGLPQKVTMVLNWDENNPYKGSISTWKTLKKYHFCKGNWIADFFWRVSS